MNDQLSRRGFIHNSVLATTGLAAGAGLPARTDAAESKPAAPASKPLLPTGKIGGLQFTRLILGGNLLTRYNHARDLGYVNKLVRSYNTDNKVRETIELAEANGINTLSVNVTAAVCKVLNDHRKNGGKMQWILYSTANIEDVASYDGQIQQMVNDGTEAIYIWGCHCDRYLGEGKFSVITKTLERIKQHNVPCGIGAHDLAVVQQCEKDKLPVEFYIKTLHHHRYPTAPRTGEATRNTSEVPGYWCRDPEETVAFMKTVEKPWIAFKVMAAGAIPPKNAFPYAFSSGGDFVLAGMFDFDVAEDCEIARAAVAQAQERTRPWRA
ncbi:MAG: hypothetical protein NTY01_06175 [Verrucomicrobia bacterium]|nr:hypothetical protein [Verrucomicrobiota bacterium]